MMKTRCNPIDSDEARSTFSAGDTLVYGTQGVCRIKEISTLQFGKTQTEYYILTPVADERSVVYVPTGSEKLVSKMRELISREELDELKKEVKWPKEKEELRPFFFSFPFWFFSTVFRLPLQRCDQAKNRLLLRKNRQF